MFELLALALLQFSTMFSSPTQSTQNFSGGSSGWGDGNITTQKTTQKASGGSSGWGDGNVTTQSASGGSSGWGDGNL